MRNPTCRHCGETIRPVSDPVIPTGYVHDLSGNSFCDVLVPSQAVTNRGLPGRTEAEPDDAAGRSNMGELTDHARCNNCMIIYPQDIVRCEKCGTDKYLMQPFVVSAAHGEDGSVPVGLAIVLGLLPLMAAIAWFTAAMFGALAVI